MNHALIPPTIKEARDARLKQRTVMQREPLAAPVEPPAAPASDLLIADLTIAARLKGREADYQRLMASPDGLLGESTGYHTIDDATLGLQSEVVYIHGAFAHGGKTSLMLAMMRRMAKRWERESNKKAVLFFSLDQTASSMVDRLLSIEEHRPTVVIDEHWLEFCHKDYPWMNRIFLVGRESFEKIAGENSVQNIALWLRRLQDAGYEVPVVIVDYIQIMSRWLEIDNPTIAAEVVADSLKTIAEQAHVAMWLGSVLRTPNTPGKRSLDQLGADLLRWSRELENMADVILVSAPIQEHVDEKGGMLYGGKWVKIRRGQSLLLNRQVTLALKVTTGQLFDSVDLLRQGKQGLSQDFFDTYLYERQGNEYIARYNPKRRFSVPA